jgi:hypothetical protein
LAAAMEQKPDKPLNEKFLNNYCNRIVKANDLLLSWFESL